MRFWHASYTLAVQMATENDNQTTDGTDVLAYIGAGLVLLVILSVVVLAIYALIYIQFIFD